VKPAYDPAPQEEPMRIVSLGLVLVLLAAAGAPAALRAQAADRGTDRGGDINPDGLTAPATWSPGEVTTTATCDVPGCTERGGSIDPDGLTAPTAWSPGEVTTTTACDVVGCTERGGDTDPNGLTVEAQDWSRLSLWLTRLQELFRF